MNLGEGLNFQRKFLWVSRGCQASQRKGLTSGEVLELPGKFGGLPGKFGKLPGNLWIAVKFHSERTSGEVAEKLLGKFGKVPGKSGDFPEARGSLTPSQRLAKICPQNLACEHVTGFRWQRAIVSRKEVCDCMLESLDNIIWIRIHTCQQNRDQSTNARAIWVISRQEPSTTPLCFQLVLSNNEWVARHAWSGHVSYCDEYPMIARLGGN